MEEKDDIFKFEDFLGGNKIDDLKKMKSELLKEGLFSENEGYKDDEDGDVFTNQIQSQIDDEEEGYEEINQEFNPYNMDSEDDYSNTPNLDEDDVFKRMKDYGWGDLSGEQMEEFENSEEYSGTKDSVEYADEFNNYLKYIAFTPDDDDMDNEDYNIEESKSDDMDDYYKLYRDKTEDFTCDIAIEGVNQNDTEVRLIVESEDWTLMFVGEIKNGKCVIPVKKLNILNEGQTGNIKLEVNADGNLFTPWEDKFIIKVSKKVTVKVNESKSNKDKKNEPKDKPKMGVKVNVRK